MHEIWQGKGNFQCTKHRLHNKKKHINDMSLLKEAEIQSVMLQVVQETATQDKLLDSEPSNPQENYHTRNQSKTRSTTT